MSEYKLSYTASEIDEKLGKVDSLASVDTELDATSGNAVANSAVTAAINTAGSQAYAALNGVQQHETRLSAVEADMADLKENCTVDDALSPTSTNPVQNKVVAVELHRLGDDVFELNQRATTFEQDVQESFAAVGEDIEEINRRIDAIGGGGGGITVADDGNGNVTITASAGASITDDGNGNVVIM